MKAIRLFSLSLLLTFAGIVTGKAQTTFYEVTEYTPTIYMIARGEVTEEYDADATRQEIIDDYAETARCGFSQLKNPQFIFATRNNKFSLALGGRVSLRTSYDFMGAVGNIDFVPYDITPTTYANRQRVMMDATTSRLFMKAIINSKTLGRVVVYSDMDFRGGNEFSYIPRLRSAYVQLKGFTVGRDVTTFCDLEAAPQTIDFEGPNAYNFEFNQMIRYEHSFLRNHLTLGIAAEMPSVNATYGENFAPILQRVPDGIAYLQYAWGENKSSHLRASAVFRDMYLHDKGDNDNTTQFGWGVQLSGHIDITHWVDIYMNGVYGKGITPYIQELTGTPYDFIYNPEKPTSLLTLPMWGWQAAAQINIVPGVFWLAGGYSMVNLDKDKGYLADDQYHRSSYIFGNAFCNITPNFTVALEYLRGMRENMNKDKAHANRVNLLLQYNF